MGHFVDDKGKAFVGPSKELDVEIELGFFVGVGTQRFERIKIEDADEHIFGVVMLNDWSSTATPL
jgi:fumarylacetoacetase